MKKNMLKITTTLLFVIAFTIILSGCVSAQDADVSVNKFVNQTTVNVNEQYFYVISVSNAGPDSATGVQVTDQLPSTLNFITATPTQGTYDPISGVWDIGTILSGDTAFMNIYASPNSSAAGTFVTNTATKTHENEIDPTEPDTSSVQIYVPEADVAVTKLTSNPAPEVGQQFTYTINVTNNGPDAATGVQITDPLPAGITFNGFVSLTQGIAIYTLGTNTITWDLTSPIASGVTESLIFTVTRDVSTAITNSATKTAQDQFDPTTPDVGSVTIPEITADIVVNKFTSNPTPNVGQQFFYVISVLNSGPNTATGVQVTDLLPSTLNFITATPTQGTYNPITGLWNIGTILSGNTVFLNIYASPNASAAGTTVTNTATKTAEDQFDPTVPDTASVDINVPEADVQISKFTSNPTPNVGESFFYTIVASNLGPDNATGVQVTDMIPAGLNFISATPSQGTYNNLTGLWNIGTILSGSTVFLTLNVSPQASAADTTITNTATKTAQNEFDPTTPDTASVDVFVPEADVELTKTTSNPTPNVGEPFNFTVTATNLGPDDATGVQVTDMIPAGLTFISYTATQGTYNAITGIWDIGTILDGNSAILTLTVEPTLSAANSMITNTATVTANEFDPTPDDDTASATVQVPAAADLAITKTADNLNPTVGDLVTFTLTVTNLGPDTGVDVVVNDVLPAGFEFVSSNASIGSYDPLTGVWTIGDMLAGDVETLTIVAEAETAGTFLNTAIVSSDTFDPNLLNNFSSVITVISPVPTPTPTPTPESTTSAQAQTVPMQPTGAPIVPLLLSALAILGGLAVAKRK